jgi:hypothetical protein
MKLPLALALFFAASLCLADGTTPKPSARRSKQELQTEVANSNAHIQELEKEKEQAIQAAKVRIPAAQEGITLLKKYDTLLRARYVDEEGSFEPATELGADDRDKINQLLKVYLHWTPLKLKSRISAGKARKTIADGIDTLKEWVSNYDSPDEDNNSDVEIISKQIQDEKQNVALLCETANNLGYKIDESAVASNYVAHPARMPASR